MGNAASKNSLSLNSKNESIQSEKKLPVIYRWLLRSEMKEKDRKSLKPSGVVAPLCLNLHLQSLVNFSCPVASSWAS